MSLEAGVPGGPFGCVRCSRDPGRPAGETARSANLPSSLDGRRSVRIGWWAYDIYRVFVSLYVAVQSIVCCYIFLALVYHRWVSDVYDNCSEDAFGASNTNL